MFFNLKYLRQILKQSLLACFYGNCFFLLKVGNLDVSYEMKPVASPIHVND
jgi:hypothetical protein